ncbi:conserved hypothetical protein, putative flagellin protein (fragment) [Methylorubrum extorquens AM1]|uniref:Flagellin N-terminal domain-containing protein n=1 Tax=Methylorubrum extorquens (strain ATCC 14718 / DSM 1338 / JCM 2805 / NCIMB 9133 / AM1) TaxID=272630 RepID=C5B389_METEA
MEFIFEERSVFEDVRAARTGGGRPKSEPRMSSSITLSAATRQNLLSLQDTAGLAATNQGRLATGRKVNSALDNPVNYFTAQSLSDRSSALSGLLDGISNGIQTIQAANTGASKIADLVKSLQSTIAQAQSDAAANRPTVTGSALATAAQAKSAGTSLRTTVMNMALGGTAAPPSDTAAGALGISGAALSVTLTDGENTFTRALTPTSTVGDLVDAINASGLATAAVDDAGKLTVTGNSDKLKVGVGGGTNATVRDAEERVRPRRHSDGIDARAARHSRRLRLRGRHARRVRPERRIGRRHAPSGDPGRRDGHRPRDRHRCAARRRQAPRRGTEDVPRRARQDQRAYHRRAGRCGHRDGGDQAEGAAGSTGSRRTGAQHRQRRAPSHPDLVPVVMVCERITQPLSRRSGIPLAS